MTKTGTHDTVLSIGPSTAGAAWAILTADGEIAEQGRDLQDVASLLRRFMPGEVIVLVRGGPNRMGDLGQALDVAQTCEGWAANVRARAGQRPHVVILAATRDDAGGAIEAARWWIEQTGAGAEVGSDRARRHARSKATAAIEAGGLTR